MRGVTGRELKIGDVVIADELQGDGPCSAGVMIDTDEAGLVHYAEGIGVIELDPSRR